MNSVHAQVRLAGARFVRQCGAVCLHCEHTRARVFTGTLPHPFTPRLFYYSPLTDCLQHSQKQSKFKTKPEHFVFP